MPWSLSPDFLKQRNILIFNCSTFRYDAVTLERWKTLAQQQQLHIPDDLSTVCPAVRLYCLQTAERSVLQSQCLREVLVITHRTTTTDTNKQTNKQSSKGFRPASLPARCKAGNLYNTTGTCPVTKFRCRREGGPVLQNVTPCSLVAR